MKVSNCFPEKLFHFPSQPVKYKWSNFFTPLSAFRIVTIFYFCSSDRYVVKLIEVLICISLLASDVQSFHMLIAISISYSVKCLFMSFVHVLIGIFFSYCWTLRVLHIFWAQVLCHIYALQRFFPNLCFIFSFSWKYLLKSRCFKFWWSPAYQFVSCDRAFGARLSNLWLT